MDSIVRTVCSSGWMAALAVVSPAFAQPASVLSPVPQEPPAAESSGSAQSAAEASPAIPLEGVEVRGKRNLFDEQAARRKKLLEESAPCLGCDAKPITRRPKLLERLANAALNQITPQAPAPPDDAGKIQSEVINQSAFPLNSSP